jgi:dTDP-4-amino-4,6-dideoxygalactose transaminase
VKKRTITIGTADLDKTAYKYLKEAVDNERISGGKFVRKLEKKFADIINVPYCIAVSSGTMADTIALSALKEEGVKEGGEVLVPALNFISVANSVIEAGLKPVFSDINLNTLNIDINTIDEKITDKTEILLPTHLFGKPVDMDPILEYAEDNGLFVVEDCCEAHGSRYKGKTVGSFGDFGTFSFYVAHTITTGEGGAIVTDKEDRANILRSLRAHGRACVCNVCVLNTQSGYCPLRFDQDDSDVEDRRFHFLRIGYSAKMNDLEAAVGLGQMDRFNQIIETRRKNLYHLNEGLSDYAEYFRFMKEDDDEYISPLVYPVIIKNNAPFTRKEIVDYLENNNIETRPTFGSIPTQQPAYNFLGYQKGDFPNAEYVGKNGFYIGIHQHLTKKDLNYVIETFSDFLKGI